MTAEYKHVHDLSALMPEVPPDSIISRTFHEDDRHKSILFGFAEGEELSEHTASQPAVLIFLEGNAQLTLGEERLEARAGTWVHMQPKLRHSIRATTPVLMLLILFQGSD